MQYITLIIWAVRLICPIVVFWFYWRRNSEAEKKHFDAQHPQISHTRAAMLTSYAKMKSSLESSGAKRSITLMSTEELSAQCPGNRPFNRYSRGPKRASILSIPEDNTNGFQSKERGDFKGYDTNANNSNAGRKPLTPFFPPPQDAIPPHDKSTESDAGKMNEEAVYILTGALPYRKVSVASHLFKKLTDANVKITAEVFTLMTKVALAGKDFRSAGLYLVKMEEAGFTPSKELMDALLGTPESNLSAYAEEFVPTSPDALNKIWQPRNVAVR